jgi:hypothetical protein
MDAKKLARGASPANLGGYLKKRAASSKGHMGHKHSLVGKQLLSDL